ncbi:MAG: uroporphyrinogen-III C-methyltransferase [Planctomycetia bacterium]|nr:uroporphyrinogen-III C-methyltransferase [Planctomycetia bacterium]
MATYRQPLVYLVGAGPGNPGLLTLRGRDCLAAADVVIYDKLVNLRLLEHAPAGARLICVNDLPGDHPERWPHVHRVMIECARAGQRVVRLKGGDPFIFGRGGEEAGALEQADVPYEIVPGVTSALGAGAFAAIPLTHRVHSSAVAFVTGHEYPEKPGSSVDWAALARFPGTLVIYMGISRLPQIVQTLLHHGMPADLPAAAVHRASTGDQQTLEAPLAQLPAAVLNAGLVAPAVVVIGTVVALRARLQWFEQRPLFNRRVLVTRPKHQAGDFVQRLEQLGATPYILPTVEIRDPPSWDAVDRAIAHLASYQWLVFTSSNGVHAFVKRLRHLGRDLRALGTIRLAAIGPETAAALRGYHLEPDLVPEVYRAEALAAALKERVGGQRVLLARADRAREVLRAELEAVADIEQVCVYSQVDAVLEDAEPLNCLRRGEIDFVTLTSANIARSLIRELDETSRQRIRSGEVKLVTISPVTSAAVVELGLPVAAEATVHTTAGVLAALVDLATLCREPEAAVNADP